MLNLVDILDSEFCQTFRLLFLLFCFEFCWCFEFVCCSIAPSGGWLLSVRWLVVSSAALIVSSDGDKVGKLLECWCCLLLSSLVACAAAVAADSQCCCCLRWAFLLEKAKLSGKIRWSSAKSWFALVFLLRLLIPFEVCRCLKWPSWWSSWATNRTFCLLAALDCCCCCFDNNKTRDWV